MPIRISNIKTAPARDADRAALHAALKRLKAQEAEVLGHRIIKKAWMPGIRRKSSWSTP